MSKNLSYYKRLQLKLQQKQAILADNRNILAPCAIYLQNM